MCAGAGAKNRTQQSDANFSAVIISTKLTRMLFPTRAGHSQRAAMLPSYARAMAPPAYDPCSLEIPASSLSAFTLAARIAEERSVATRSAVHRRGAQCSTTVRDVRQHDQRTTAAESGTERTPRGRTKSARGGRRGVDGSASESSRSKKLTREPFVTLSSAVA